MDKKQVLTISALIAMSSVSFSALAFNTGDVLGFDPGVSACASGDIGTFPNCNYGTVISSGSYFAMDINGNGQFTPSERTAISEGPSGGIIIGQLQPASGSHAGCPNGTESPGPDAPWCFFGNTGMQQILTTPVTDNGDGTLNFTGWGVTWNGISNIPLGGDPAHNPADTGKATIVCSHNPCQQGDTYTLDYTAHIPYGDPSGFGGVGYQLHLEKTSGTTSVTKIVLNVEGGNTQECSATGGSNVKIDASTTLATGETQSSIAWSIDGTAVTGGDSISEFLALGSHDIKATVTTSSGSTATNSTNVVVRDTTKPVLSIGFKDNRTGESITSVTSDRWVQFVGISMVATDVCDSSPATKGALTPVMEVVSGDRIKIFGNNGNVDLPVSAVQLVGSATDASGNVTSGQAILSVK